MAFDPIPLSVWVVMAFWTWQALGRALRGLGVPQAFAVAAVLAWVGAGVSLPWVLHLMARVAPAWAGLGAVAH